MILGVLLLLAGLTISAVAIYYSVLGLAAIFAAAVTPIYIMGGTLEVAKLIAASWLKANWSRATGFIKWYMLSAVAILMMITSMGIFGFLSKAHLDQGIVSGNNQVQISEIDRQIAIERRSIQDAELVIAQLDQVVQVLTEAQRIRGNDGAIAVRRSQTQERSELIDIIRSANLRISELENQKMPLVQERLAIEAEVGPIKYIAQFVYGSNPDKDILEKAVTWVIVLLVIVFDPLAIAMLLAAQMTFSWYRQDKEQKIAVSNTDNAVVDNDNQVDLTRDNRSSTILEENIPTADNSGLTDTTEQDFDISKHPYLFKKFDHFKDLKPLVAKSEQEDWTDKDIEQLAQETFEDIEKEESKPTYQILPELVEESSKKKIHDQEAGQSSNSGEEIAYVQNGEQSESSLWKRFRDRISDQFKPKDYLIVVYNKGAFEDFQYDAEREPELDKFIKDIQSGTHSFGDYEPEKLQLFASKIYELRKN